MRDLKLQPVMVSLCLMFRPADDADLRHEQGNEIVLVQTHLIPLDFGGEADLPKLVGNSHLKETLVRGSHWGIGEFGLNALKYLFNLRELAWIRLYVGECFGHHPILSFPTAGVNHCLAQQIPCRTCTETPATV